MMPVTVEIRRASDAFVTRERGRLTRHGFSFGPHYDPDNVAFGAMVCHDDHLLSGGQGFADHSHVDVEIVTWVLRGALTHTDSAHPGGTVGPGTVQVLSAGSGVVHAETVAPDAGATRFVQVWLTPDRLGTTPSYAVAPVSLPDGELVPVASGHDPEAAVRLGTAGATFSVARLPAGRTLALPDAPRLHVYVGTGALVRSSLARPLAEGDAFRFTDASGVEVTAAVPTELLVWTFT
jgi:redox-sensitive bicupin YhaK (pirin superfamily)